MLQNNQATFIIMFDLCFDFFYGFYIVINLISYFTIFENWILMA